MATKTTGRDELLARAAAVLPNGVSSGGRAKFHEVIVRTEGAYVWNAEGKRYIDYLLAYGPIVVGHSDPRVNEAVARAVATCDLNWVGPQAGEIELAEQICEVMPCAARVAFCTSGTDASLHAVHLARAATGRVKLLKFHGSYHGWHDQLAVGSRLRLGSGSGSAGADLAAVFAEPYVHSCGCVAPAEGWLEEIRRLCTAHGAALVFDEIKTGFRQQRLLDRGRRGRAEILGLLGSASEKTATIEGTYNASPYATAAGLAVLAILRDGGIERLYALGDRLRAGLAGAVATSDIPACVTGWGSEWMIYFSAEPPRNYREVGATDLERHERFRQAMLEEGILEPPFPSSDKRLCIALSEADVDETVEAASRALAAVA